MIKVVLDADVLMEVEVIVALLATLTPQFAAAWKRHEGAT